MMAKRWWWALCGCALVSMAGCPDDGGGEADAGSDAVADTSADAAPTGRPYLLGGRAETYDPTARRQWTPSFDVIGGDLGDLLEVVVVPLDLYGIPWSSFTGPDNRPTQLPGPWLSAVNALQAEAAATGKPIVLSLSPLAATWDTLAPDAREQSGILVLNDAWRPYCYDPSADADPAKWRDVYGGYAVWVVDKFDPDWVILGSRVNRYEERCGASAYEAVVGFATEAHRRLAELADPPTTIVSVDIDDLYGYPAKPGRCVAIAPEACLAQRQDLLDVISADVLGLESYPAEALADLGVMPADWFSRVADLRGDRAAAIVGTALPALEMASSEGFCLPLLGSSEALQAEWLDQAIDAAEDARMPLMIWRSLRDLAAADVVASCPCAGDAALCQHFDQLGAKADEVRLQLAAGLVGADGAERQAVSLWRQAMAKE